MDGYEGDLAIYTNELAETLRRIRGLIDTCKEQHCDTEEIIDTLFETIPMLIDGVVPRTVQSDIPF